MNFLYIYLIIITIAFIGFYIGFEKNKYSPAEIFGYLFSISFVSGIIMFFSFIIVGDYIEKNYYISHPIEYRENIKSLVLNNNLTIKGDGWFLGWSINSKNEMVYYFYKDTNNGLILASSKAEDTYINESSYAPQFITTFEIREPKYPDWSLSSCNNQKDMRCRLNNKYFLVVPYNTIKLHFDVKQ